MPSPPEGFQEQLEGIQGGVMGRLNGIIHMIQNPCNEPWIVYVEAAVPWANKAAMHILGVDIMQSVRTGLNPGDFRTKRHARGGFKGEHPGKERVPGIPDPYEWIGHHYKEQLDGFIQANATKGTRAIWQITNVVERGLWEFFLLDVGSEFLYHSLADARRNKYCRRWGNGDGLRSGPTGALGVAGWSAMLNLEEKYHNPPVSMIQGGAQVIGDYHGELTVAASFSGIAIGGTGMQEAGFRIVNSFTGEVLSQDGPIPVATGQPVEFVGSGTCNVPGEIRAELFSRLGSLAGEGIIYATFTGGPNEHPRPPKPPHHHHPRPTKWPKWWNIYTTSDGQTVYDMGNEKSFKPRRVRRIHETPIGG